MGCAEMCSVGVYVSYIRVLGICQSVCELCQDELAVRMYLGYVEECGLYRNVCASYDYRSTGLVFFKARSQFRRYICLGID